jgi:hypothetical protein
MEKTTIKLIDTEFSVEDAREVILSLIHHKIKYHQMELFSSEERFGEPNQHSIDRLEELNKSSKEVMRWVELNKQQLKKVKVKSSITLEIIE